MSMNLMCDDLELWQTPTHVTYMCLVDKDGLVPSSATGNKAKRALQIYLRWVKSTINGVWEDAGELQIAKDILDEHTTEVEDFIVSRGKKIEIYSL